MVNVQRHFETVYCIRRVSRRFKSNLLQNVRHIEKVCDIV